MNKSTLSALAWSRYTSEPGSAYLTGIQALARLPIDQRRLDAVAGLDTAGFVSGYRGSPLGGLDRELWQQKLLLAEHGVIFQPGVNEDLAATAVWGTQQVGLFPGARHQGVFGLGTARHLAWIVPWMQYATATPQARARTAAFC